MDKVLPDIRSMTQEEIAAAFTADGLPRYRAGQVYAWLAKGADSFDDMTNLPLDLRRRLAERYAICRVTVARKLVSRLDGTVKYLFGLQDGHCVEGVVMHYHHGHTLCLSTQVGCRMGCAFCATGAAGFVRNLTAGEMIGQITAAQQDLGLRLANLVLMGMGEPLDNYQNTLRFLRLVTSPDHLNIGARHISLSTCGLVDGIRRLQGEGIPLTLSVSLHAPDDAIRSRIMPVNKKWNVDALLAACRDYLAADGRRISFEYILIDGVNDSLACADRLADRLRGMLCHVNLIPANPVPGKTHAATGRKTAEAFERRLTERGINATIRRTLGSDINASCGQLRNTSDPSQNAENA